MSEQQPYDACDHCKKPGELGRDLRAHAVEVPGQQKRVVRLLHVERCAVEWFEKYNAWLTARGTRKT